MALVEKVTVPSSPLLASSTVGILGPPPVREDRVSPIEIYESN